MKLDSVAVLGGGPAGLYAARLFKLTHPDTAVSVHEQSLPETTFGFGVALAGRTQRNLEAADPDTQSDILAAGLRHDREMLVAGQGSRVSDGALIGIARPELLAILRRHAQAAGVQLHYGARVELAALNADLVVVADGVSSPTRTGLADAFGAKVDVAGCLYLWAASDFALDRAIFAPVTTRHGTFVTHAYPYQPDRSTFLIETDEATWRAAGFDVTTESTSPDESDTTALEYLREAFAEHLDGHHLIGNRTRWMRFRTVHCERWTHRNVVLIGDAAHTAHYSVGSGTKLAMEDAIALRDAVDEAADLGSALRNYERIRRPQVERLQELARRSQLWWDTFPRRTHLPVDQLMLAYMTRTGNVSLRRLADTNPDLVRRGLAQFAGIAADEVEAPDPVDWVLRRPLSRRRVGCDTRRITVDRRDDLIAPSAGRLVPIETGVSDPWCPAADELVKRVHELVGSGWSGCWLTGPDDRGSVLTRLDLGERIRAETDGLVAVEGPEEFIEDLAAGVASARADLVCPTPGR